MEWNYSSIIHLIKEYEKRVELWNPQHELYRSVPSKHRAWASLAKIFNADVVDIRRKLNSLFASYRREKIKIRQGQGTKWFVYKYLKFLPSYQKVDGNNGGDNDDEQIQDEEYLEENEDEAYEPNQEEQVTGDEYIELAQEDNNEVNINIKQEHTEVPKTFTQKIQRRPVKRIIPTALHGKKRLKILRRYDTEYQIRPEIPREYPRKKDDCDSFGEYIADSLRKHDERTKSMIKHAINNIIFEQEMKKYSNHYEIVHEMENPLVLGEE